MGLLYAKIYDIMVQFFISPEMLLSPCRTPPLMLFAQVKSSKILFHSVPVCPPVLEEEEEEEEVVSCIQPSSEGHLNP